MKIIRKMLTSKQMSASKGRGIRRRLVFYALDSAVGLKKYRDQARIYD